MFLAKNDTTLSLEKRCELLSLNRSTTYYKLLPAKAVSFS
jgi:hypothetical protein